MLVGACSLFQNFDSWHLKPTGLPTRKSNFLAYEDILRYECPSPLWTFFAFAFLKQSLFKLLPSVQWQSWDSVIVTRNNFLDSTIKAMIRLQSLASMFKSDRIWLLTRHPNIIFVTTKRCFKINVTLIWNNCS